MTDKLPKDVEDDQLPEPEAEERFGRLVGNLVNTPHKPHKPHNEEMQPKQRDGK